MIKQFSHTVTAAGPAGFALALEVAYELHAPVPRAPEVASASASGGRARRTTSSRARRRTTARG